MEVQPESPDVDHFEENDTNVENKKNKNDGEPWDRNDYVFAQVIKKTLKAKKPRRKKGIVLSRRKKLTTSNEEKLDFQIIEDPIKQEESSNDEENLEQKVTSVKAIKELRKLKLPKKQLINNVRIKPDVLDRNRERTLSKIATKGIIQLFNAVRQHQNDVTGKLKEAGGSEIKRERALKSIDKQTFLDVVLGSSKSIPVETSMKGEKQPSWSVLREDFMLGSKLKDWDKDDSIQMSDQTKNSKHR